MSYFCMYLRKSRADSDTETVESVLERHCKILQDFAINSLGELIPEERIFREVVSGENIDDRPKMLELLRLIQSQNVTGVLVIDPQRLSRGDLSDCGTVTRYFRYTSTRIITPARTYDLSDRFDRKFFEMELMRGSDYLEYVKEIMLRGRIASVNEGNFIGSVPPYGYMKQKIGKSFTLVPCQEAENVQLMYRMWCEEGASISDISVQLDNLGIRPRKSPKWSVASIRDILRNPVYTGVIRWNCRKTVKKFLNGRLVTSRPISPENLWITAPGKHEAIISHEFFQKSLNRFDSSPKNCTSHNARNPFAGLIRCECGYFIVYQPSKTGSPRLHCTNQKNCHNRSILYNEVESNVLKLLSIISALYSGLCTEISEICSLNLLSDPEIPANYKNLLLKSILKIIVIRRSIADYPGYSLDITFR